KVRKPERVPGQGWRTDAAPKDGGRIDIRELTAPEIDRVDARLPLHRLDIGRTYLVAWDDDDPVDHVCLALSETKLGVPEIQDVFVLPTHRREGIATELSRAAERLASERGHDRISLGVGLANAPARRLYERL